MGCISSSNNPKNQNNTNERITSKHLIPNDQDRTIIKKGKDATVEEKLQINIDQTFEQQSKNLVKNSQNIIKTQKIHDKQRLTEQNKNALNKTQADNSFNMPDIQLQSQQVKIPQQSVKFSRNSFNKAGKVNQINPIVSLNQTEKVQVQQKNIQNNVQAPKVQQSRQNKQNLARQQLLKKYHIKVQKQSEKVLSINSFKYENMMVLNPQHIEEHYRNTSKTIKLEQQRTIQA